MTESPPTTEWTTSLKRKLNQWRGSKRRPKSVKKLKQDLSPREYRSLTLKAYTDAYRTAKKSWDEEYQKLHEETMRLWGEAPDSDTPSDAPLDPRHDAYLFATPGFRFVQGRNNARNVGKAWLRVGGITYALDVFSLVDEVSAQLAKTKTIDEAEYDILNLIRRQLIALTDEEYADVRDHAHTLWNDADTRMRARLAYLFPDEQTWAHELIEALPRRRFSQRDYARGSVEDTVYGILFGSGADAEHMYRLADLMHPEHLPPDASIPDRHYANDDAWGALRDLVDHLEAEAKRPLLHLAALPWQKLPIPVIDALMMLDDPEIATVLARQYVHITQWTRDSYADPFPDYFRDHPTTAVAILDEVLEEFEDDPPHNFDAAVSLRDELKALLSEQHLEEEHGELYATREDLPDILASPLWRDEDGEISGRRTKVPKSVKGLDPLSIEANVEPTDSVVTKFSKRYGAKHDQDALPTDEEHRATLLNPEATRRDWGGAFRELSQPAVDDLLEHADPKDLAHLPSWIFWAMLPQFVEHPEYLHTWLSADPDLKDLMRMMKAGIAAPGMIDAVETMVGQKSRKEDALTWVTGHPREALIGAIPAFINTRGKKKRSRLEEIMRTVSEAAPEVYDEVLDEYGEEVADALPSFRPIDRFPRKMPNLPKFWNPAAYPDIRLERDPSKRLPLEVYEDIGLMLKFSSVDEPYVGLNEVAAAVDDTSMGEFVWALFQAWINDGCDTKEEWVLNALALFGGPHVGEELPGILDRWASSRYYKRSEKVIAAIEQAPSVSPYIIEALWRTIHGAFNSDLRHDASKILVARVDADVDSEIAVDRLTPTFGMTEHGRLDLTDSGELTVWLDDNLEPHLKGDTDILEQDDPTRLRWERLGRLCARQAKFQSMRLERALRTRRRWRTSEWREDIAAHPLLGMLAHRILWGSYDEDATLLQTWRVDELGDLLDAEDEPLPLEDDAFIRIVHPIELEQEQAEAWVEVFSDYEIIQPFEQLGRTVYTSPDEYTQMLDVLEGAQGRMHDVKRMNLGNDWSSKYNRKRTHSVRYLGRSVRKAPNHIGSCRVKVELGVAIPVGRTIPDEHVTKIRALEVHPEPKTDAGWNAFDPIDLSELFVELGRAFNA